MQLLEAGYDLVVVFKDNPDTSGAVLRFDTSALSPARAEQLRTHFQAMVKQVLKNPKQPALDISRLPVKETHMLLEHFGRGKEILLDHPTVIHAFREALNR